MAIKGNLDAAEMLRDPATFRLALVDWLAARTDELAPFHARAAGSIEAAFAHEAPLRQLLGEADWTRYGWPVDAGGLGGTAVLRALLYEELTVAGLIVPEAFTVLETIGPMLCSYAPALAAGEMTAFARGDRMWCQGFSEPDAGSDMASIRTRADATADGFRINGQKTWVSFGHLADACGLLVRTGDAESRHRGLSILWVDLDAPGVTVRPIAAASGRHEFSELFFDDVEVEADRLVGELNGGWGVAMHLLQFERGMYGWIRQACLLRTLDEAVAGAATRRATPTDAGLLVGRAYLAVLSLRLRCLASVERLARGEFLGPEISIDKLLLSAAEKAVYAAVRELLGDAFVDGDDDVAVAARSEWFFAQAASIYGGAAEVQRDIVGEHLLRLPRAR